MAAIFHQVEVIQLDQGILLRADGLDELFLMIVAEHQDMGQLDGGVPADPLAGRDALDDRPLRRTNGGGGAGGVVIRVQVDHADQALADAAVFQGTLNINQGMGIRLENVLVQVLGHGLVDDSRMGGLLLRAQLGLRQDQVNGRGRTLGVLADSFPVSRVRSELIAGDHRPLGDVLYLREQNISG